MTAPRAADLPVGSVVEFLLSELEGTIHARRFRDAFAPWGSLAWGAEWDGPIGGTVFTDWMIQEKLDNGGRVLRVGDGSGQ